ncbi:LysR family transcriptional regulator [Herbaspirillum sp. YR522]|uniref:LysR family transcriptional regulator n=1 Tax=Herbaspirillum sp. YR522 TaxID=1144342 RepID=UPI00026F90A7|nr:LysR family transcriptional regulator [Herbaspirillum sp. YR522]EJN09843.1 transcriptional regulator [Herbaspirillum sp. YR522]
MARENYNDLLAFVAVAREGSFTRAAAQLGVSQSALSHTIRALETRLGLRLLTRTTRSVSATEAGERLMSSIAPRFEEIEAELAALSSLKDKPSGTIRLSAAEHAANTVLWPGLLKLAEDYPEINIEICVDYGLTDIVAGRYDAGVRLGDQVEKDMIAVRIAPDLRMAVVGSPGYLAGRRRPQEPADLAAHECINLRLPTHGGLMSWEFERDGHKVKARVEGQWTFNSSEPMLRAALQGFGLAYLPHDMVQAHVASGALKHVMKSWSPTFPGYHLYYASRRQASPAFGLLVEALRYKGPHPC